MRDSSGRAPLAVKRRRTLEAFRPTRRASSALDRPRSTPSTSRALITASICAVWQGGPDDFLLVPRGAGHTFGNDGDEPARLLVLHAPAMDGYFAELDALWSRESPPAPEEEHALMARYGMGPA